MHLFRWMIGLQLLGLMGPHSFLLGQPSSCQQAWMLQQTIEKHHYAPRSLNEELSTVIIEQFLDHLDPQKMFLLETQVEEMKAAFSDLPIQIKQKDCRGLTRAVELYTKQLDWVDNLLANWEQVPWSEEAQEGEENKGSFAATSEALEDRWRKYFQALLRNQFSDSTARPDASDWNQAWLDRIQAERCQLSLRLNHPEGLDEVVGKRFLSAFAKAQDPHTNYLSFNQKERFEYQLSEEAATFGFELVQNSRGEIEIAALVPGGAAWNSQALNEGDILLSIQVPGKPKLDFDCQAMIEAFRILGSPSVSEANFSIRKTSGEKRLVHLRKRKLSLSDQGIRSVLLEGSVRLGYLYLPSFYVDDSKGNGRRKGASDQLATELIRLKRQGIEGLILDVRGNGGGSMYEAMRIAGLFINFGAVAMTDDRMDGPELLKDMSRGMAFSKPLLVLQDRTSASASELFSACMQDYHRGLVVGDTSFGKASMQQILPIDAYKTQHLSADRLNPLAPAFVKLTTGKFYRVTGKKPPIYRSDA